MHPSPSYKRRRPEKTLLYKIVQENWLTFKDKAESEGENLPKYVTEEFEKYLKCGILAHGFLRNRCEDCGHENLIGFSCKGRGFCGSCLGRKMSESTIFLCEQVIPQIPVRQWVLSVPIPLRYWMATNTKLMTLIQAIAYKVISSHYRKMVKSTGGKIDKTSKVGAVSLIQRFGSDLRLNIHLHMIFSEGVWNKEGLFIESRGPTDLDVKRVVEKIKSKCLTLLVRLGYLRPDEGGFAEVEREKIGHPLLNQAIGASIRGRQLFKPNFAVPKIGAWDKEEVPKISGPKCAAIDHWSLHANTYIGAKDRKGLERLVGYVTRPSICEARLSLSSKGDVIYKLKKTFSDGTTHVVLNPLEFIGRLASLVPKPRAHLIQYFGMFARRTKNRDQVVTKKEVKESKVPGPCRIAWAKLLKKVFGIDLEICSHCGGKMKILKPVTTAMAIKKILDHLNIDSRAPPISPSRLRHTEQFDFGA